MPRCSPCWPGNSRSRTRSPGGMRCWPAREPGREQQAGYVVVFRAVDELRQHAEDVFRDVVSILPSVCDRWRTIGTPFSVVIVGGCLLSNRP